MNITKLLFHLITMMHLNFLKDLLSYNVMGNTDMLTDSGTILLIKMNSFIQ